MAGEVVGCREVVAGGWMDGWGEGCQPELAIWRVESRDGRVLGVLMMDDMWGDGGSGCHVREVGDIVAQEVGGWLVAIWETKADTRGSEGLRIEVKETL